jgi:hypothetical protein
MKNRTSVYIAMSVLASCIIQIARGKLNIGSLIGGAIALVVMPYFLSNIVIYFLKIVKVDWGNPFFHRAYIIFWITGVFLNSVTIFTN